MLLPLLIGGAIWFGAAPVADKLFPVVKRVAGLSTLLLLGFTVVFYRGEFLAAVGSFAIGAQVLFVLGVALVTYGIGFGLLQAQRSAMALGMCSRNGAAMFSVYSAIPNPDPHVLVMILLAVPVPAMVAFPVARFFILPGRQARCGR